MTDKQRIFSVTLDDCKIEYSKGRGGGGQRRDKVETCVRITHPPSGAVGNSCDERSQLQNKRLAFRRMANSPKFQTWIRRQFGRDTLASIEVDRAMWPVNIKTEVQEDGKWVEKAIETPNWREVK